jgi:hypothetical protein
MGICSPKCKGLFFWSQCSTNEGWESVRNVPSSHYSVIQFWGIFYTVQQRTSARWRCALLLMRSVSHILFLLSSPHITLYYFSTFHLFPGATVQTDHVHPSLHLRLLSDEHKLNHHLSHPSLIPLKIFLCFRWYWRSLAYYSRPLRRWVSTVTQLNPKGLLCLPAWS